jgi:hypothetical protein
MKRHIEKGKVNVQNEAQIKDALSLLMFGEQAIQERRQHPLSKCGYSAAASYAPGGAVGEGQAAVVREHVVYISMSTTVSSS